MQKHETENEKANRVAHDFLVATYHQSKVVQKVVFPTECPSFLRIALMFREEVGPRDFQDRIPCCPNTSGRRPRHSSLKKLYNGILNQFAKVGQIIKKL